MMRDINQEEWSELLTNDQNAIIIDVRRPDEWQQGIIKNATIMNVFR